MANWIVYIIESDDGLFYTGITVDMERRWQEHCEVCEGGKKGAKFFRGRKPERLVFMCSGYDRSTASRYEFEIKKLSRAKKLALIDSSCNGLKR